MIQEQQELAALLGGRLPTRWRAAFEANPRHLFLPEHAWRMDHHSGELTVIDRVDDERAWMSAAYSEDIIVTQRYDDGKGSSSCSMPEVVLSMLEHLDVHAGQRVMEIGTGTGWNAALLSTHLGDANVVTIEVDQEVGAAAQLALTAAGRRPTVVIGDGALGYPAGAPFDRVEATCSVHQLPYAWVEQTTPAGIILTPWGNRLSNTGLLRLEVGTDGTAQGRFVDYAAFMWLRSQKHNLPDEPEGFADSATLTRTDDDPGDLFNDDEFLFTAGMRVADCRLAWESNADATKSVWWLLGADSWASVTIADGTVRQLGPRRLWDEVCDAYSWWFDQDRPTVTRWGLTVTKAGQAAWLDRP